MSFVYFIKPVGALGPVKIGCSIDPVKRLQQLMVWSPVRLEIIAAFPGSYDDETAIQGMFSDSRSHGEWFHHSERLATFVERIRGGEPLDRAHPDFVNAKSAMRVASGQKSHLTKKVNLAEKMACRRGIKVDRPEYIAQAIAEYTGCDKPAPTAEHHALVTLYVNELRDVAFPSSRDAEA